jgi:hypothetical protein
MARRRGNRDVTVEIIQFATLAEALAAEETRWLDGVKSLTVWSSGPGLCVPASYRSVHHFIDACALMESRHWPVLVRRTGGGCVPQGPGIVNLTWMPGQDDSHSGIAELYDRFAGALIAGLANAGIPAKRHSPSGAWCRGRHDICSNGLKIAGISQRRSTGAQRLPLIHAALFIDCDLDLCFSEMNLFLRTAGCVEQPLRHAATTMAVEASISTCDEPRQFSQIIDTIAVILSRSPC